MNYPGKNEYSCADVRLYEIKSVAGASPRDQSISEDCMAYGGHANPGLLFQVKMHSCFETYATASVLFITGA